MSTNHVNETVRNFITHHFSRAHSRVLADDDSLLETGVVDSLGVLDIVSFIESEFRVSVADEELVPEYFGSINRIASYVQTKHKDCQV